jgi:hypothetical protein
MRHTTKGAQTQCDSSFGCFLRTTCIPFIRSMAEQNQRNYIHNGRKHCEELDECKVDEDNASRNSDEEREPRLADSVKLFANFGDRMREAEAAEAATEAAAAQQQQQAQSTESTSDSAAAQKPPATRKL